MKGFGNVIVNNFNPVQGGQTYYIPAKNKSFVLDEQIGRETIYFVASRQNYVVLEIQYQVMQLFQQHNISIASELVMIKPFSTDGCSLFPDGSLTNKTLWQACCIEHDKAYWQGGTYEERKAADEALEKCVGQPEIATLMLNGVRIGGSPYWPTPFW